MFSEPMVFICGEASDYPETVELGMLSSRNEVFIDWFMGFSEWHSKKFGKNAFPQISVNIMSQLKLFAEKKNNWAIVPLTVAKGLCESARVRMCKTAFETPVRRVNCLLAKSRKQNVYVSEFLNCLTEELNNYKEIEKYEIEI